MNRNVKRLVRDVKRLVRKGPKKIVKVWSLTTPLLIVKFFEIFFFF